MSPLSRREPLGVSPSYTMMQIQRSSVRTIFLVVFVCAYLVFGAIVFSLLEEKPENALKLAVRDRRQHFLGNFTCIQDAELEEFIVAIIKANNRGVSAARNVSSEPNWSFGQSLFFAGTILTTIGYGHVTPLSEGGKLFCILYAMIGIPLTLILFTALVERLMIITIRFLGLLTRMLGRTHPELHVRILHVTIMLTLLVVTMFVVPAFIFNTLEKNWNYLDAFYYCFISLTTIGLGDYIPGDELDQKQRPLYKICATLYLFVGLTMMMLTLASIYDVPQLNIGYHFYLKSDENKPECSRLSESPVGPRYTEEAGYHGPAAGDESGYHGPAAGDESGYHGPAAGDESRD